MPTAIGALAAIDTALAENGWWVLSRASGLLALVLVTVSVALGLAMAGRPPQRPGMNRWLAAVHQQTALAGLIAISLHGVALLLDPWLQPGAVGVAIPFALSFQTFFTGLGTIAAYLAMLLGLSFYARKRIGAKLWRKAHRATILVYLLGLVHALGAGSDTGSAWFAVWTVGSGLPIAILLVYRLGASQRVERRRRAAARQRRRETVRGELQERGGEEYEGSLIFR